MLYLRLASAEIYIYMSWINVTLLDWQTLKICGMFLCLERLSKIFCNYSHIILWVSRGKMNINFCAHYIKSIFNEGWSYICISLQISWMYLIYKPCSLSNGRIRFLGLNNPMTFIFAIKCYNRISNIWQYQFESVPDWTPQFTVVWHDWALLEF